MSKIVIIGNGIAGITAARHIRKLSDHEVKVVSSESKYFFSRTALMYVYMGHMKFEHTQPYEDWFWKKNRIDLVQDEVVTIDRAMKLVTLNSGENIPYDKLILATGSRPRRLPIDGSDLAGVQSLYHKQDLELMERKTSSISQGLIIGGGLIGVEMAEMLHSRGIKVVMLVREDNFWDIVLPEEEAIIVTKHIRSRGVQLELATSATEIKGGEHVESILDSNGKIHHAEFVGITIGVDPNKTLADQIGIDSDQGILVDENLVTSDPNIYAIGDCAEIRSPNDGRRPVEAVWYTGRIMGETVAQTICGQTTGYDPGIWFNSAKFFDLEYQTYGYVPNKPESNYTSLFWHDDKDHALRMVFDEAESLVGVNTLGIRLKHDVCSQWIEANRNVSFVLDNIEDMNFDPEFYKNYLKIAASHFKQQIHA